MQVDGLHVMVDGISLELFQGTGLRTYSVTLLQALRQLGAETSVLISKSSLLNDKQYRTNTFGLFRRDGHRKQDIVTHNYPLYLKILFQVPDKVRYFRAPPNMILTRDIPSFKFVNEVGLFASRDCYAIAHRMSCLGLHLKIKPDRRIDVWHTTYFTPVEVPSSNRISTIHDIIPLRLPHTTLNDKGMFIRQLRFTLKKSRFILCVSENTRNDLLEFFDVHPDKVHVTYQPVIVRDSDLTEAAIERGLRYYHLSYKNYVLFVGAIEPKKNLRRLIQAWLSLDVDFPLVIVGKKAWLWHQELKVLLDSEKSLARHHRRVVKQVRLLDFVPQSDLPILYKGAKCLAFPSLYEGFGLPPLEAMTLGCPVVASSMGSLPEVCADAAHYCDAFSPKDIGDKIMEVISDKALRSDLIAKGYERAAYFSMENYKKRLLSVYRRI